MRTTKLAFLILCLPFKAISAITTPEIIAHTITAAPSCIKYELRGSCQWLKGGAIPVVVSTPRVRHYVPEAVVTVYGNSKKFPWFELKLVEKTSFAASSQIFKAFTDAKLEQGSISGLGSNVPNIHLREASVHGHPLGSGILKVFPKLILHEANSIAMMPYYSSRLDVVSWRNPSSEIFNWHKVLIPKYSVGKQGENWGTIYPRAGFVDNFDANKASSVIALRAVNLVTSNSWSHVSHVIDKGSCGVKCSTPGEALDDDKTLFQPIYPNAKHSCEPMKDALIESGNAKMWVVWRQYDGCVQFPGKFLGSI